MSRDSGFNTGLLLGVVIGGAAALLLSPKSGKKNRAELSSKLDEASKQWRDSNGDVKATLSALFDSNATVDKARAYFDKALADAKITLADLKQKDLETFIADVQANFENDDNVEYNDNWIEELKAEWQDALNSSKPRRTRKA